MLPKWQKMSTKIRVDIFFHYMDPAKLLFLFLQLVKKLLWKNNNWNNITQEMQVSHCFLTKIYSVISWSNKLQKKKRVLHMLQTDSPLLFKSKCLI